MIFLAFLGSLHMHILFLEQEFYLDIHEMSIFQIFFFFYLELKKIPDCLPTNQISEWQRYVPTKYIS